MITTWLLSLITFCSGLILGLYLGKNGHELPTVKEVQKEIKKRITPTVPAGIIRRPSAQDLLDRKAPQSIREEREEMKKTLDNVPELKEAKDKLQNEYNKSVRGIYE